MTDANPTDNTIPEAVVVDGAESTGDFRARVTPEELAAIKAFAPTLIEMLKNNPAAFNEFIETADDEIGEVAQPDLTVDPTPTLPEVEEPAPTVESRFSGIFKKVQAKVGNPVETLKSVRADLPQYRADIDARLTKLKDSMVEEEEKMKNEIAFAAQLEEVLDNFRGDAAPDSSLAGTIDKIEKKLLLLRVRVAARHAAIPTIRGAINGQRAVRDFVSSKLSK
jgi:hypothetical protein